MRTPLFAFLVCFACLAQVVHPETDPLAGRGSPYMRMGVGSRSEALGNASAAFCEPTTVTAYWNPAMGVMLPSARTFSGGYRFLTLGRRQGYFSFTTRVPPRAALSVALLYHGDHDVPIYDDNGHLDYTGGFLSLATHVALSYKIKKNLSVGINTTIHSNSLSAGAGESDQVNSWDLGNIDVSVFYRPFRDLSLGLNVKEINSHIKWEVPTYGSEMNTVVTESVPIDVKFGAAWRTAVKSMNCAAVYDADLYLIPLADNSLSGMRKFSDGSTQLDHHLGLECFVFPEFPVRLGYGTADGFSFGTGFYFQNGKYAGHKLDYVFSVEPEGSGLMNGVSWTFAF